MLTYFVKSINIFKMGYNTIVYMREFLIWKRKHQGTMNLEASGEHIQSSLNFSTSSRSFFKFVLPFEQKDYPRLYIFYIALIIGFILTSHIIIKSLWESVNAFLHMGMRAEGTPINEFPIWLGVWLLISVIVFATFMVDLKILGLSYGNYTINADIMLYTALIFLILDIIVRGEFLHKQLLVIPILLFSIGFALQILFSWKNIPDRRIIRVAIRTLLLIFSLLLSIILLVVIVNYTWGQISLLEVIGWII